MAKKIKQMTYKAFYKKYGKEITKMIESWLMSMAEAGALTYKDKNAVEGMIAFKKIEFSCLIMDRDSVFIKSFRRS